MSSLESLESTNLAFRSRSPGRWRFSKSRRSFSTSARSRGSPEGTRNDRDTNPIIFIKEMSSCQQAVGCGELRTSALLVYVPIMIIYLLFFLFNLHTFYSILRVPANRTFRSIILFACTIVYICREPPLSHSLSHSHLLSGRLHLLQRVTLHHDPAHHRAHFHRHTADLALRGVSPHPTET